MSNILFISPQPIFGGAATANIAIAKMLENEGHRITYNDEYMVENTFLGINIDHTPIHRATKKNKNLLEYVTSNSYEAIIWGDVNLFIYLLPAIIKLKYMGIKQYAVFHSLCLDQNFKSFIIENVIAIALTYVDKYIFVSDYTLKSWSKYRLIRNKPDKLVAIHNPMLIPEFNKSFDPSHIRVGFVGRFSEEKQPSIFCALSRDNSFQYIAYGDGPLLEDLKLLYPQVVYKGICKNTDEIYSNIDVLVMTSKFENCPMVILEAKVRGIPCVVPNVGGIPEIVEDGVDGVIYQVYDTQIITTAIKKIVEDYKTYSSNCLANAKKTTPNALVDGWREIL